MIHTPEAYEAYALLAEQFGEHIEICVPGMDDTFGSRPEVFVRTVHELADWFVRITVDGNISDDAERPLASCFRSSKRDIGYALKDQS